MVRRSRAWSDVQDRQEALAEAERTHGRESEQAQLARDRHREAVERYRIALISDIEDDVLDQMSRDQ
jgi:phosphatidate phosphatase APP1